jgi:dolichyl-phosphate beta-glucosyltransferase
MNSDVFCTVVIPAYNERSRLGPTLQATRAYLREDHPHSEVIVVDDGSDDGTAALVEAFAKQDTTTDDGVPVVPIRVLRHSQRVGAGAAIKTGVLHAHGEHILCMDADLCTPIAELETLLREVQRGADVALGSRAMPASTIQIRQPWVRRVMGRVFNRLVRTVLVPGVRDTQCGFKLFTRRAARDIFSRSTLTGFACYVEVVWLAQQLGYRVREVPVRWSHKRHSKVSLVGDSWRMFRDVLTIRFRANIHTEPMAGPMVQ